MIFELMPAVCDFQVSDLIQPCILFTLANLTAGIV
jgi:hypothetical protein